MSSPVQTSTQTRPLMRKVYIVGLSGSGKTHLSARLAAHYGLHHIEIDALNWQPGWQAAEKEVLLERVRAEVELHQKWVADGNYSVLRGLLWQGADTIIWLDYPLLFVLSRLWRRTWQRVFSRIELWNGNRETLRGALFSRDSLFLYVLRVYRRRRRLYTQMFAERSNPSATYWRIRSASALECWLRELGVH
ncbi:MAG: P-loop NTPase family protein [Anaerolineae bacterium]